jgi:hypothetical protein
VFSPQVTLALSKTPPSAETATLWTSLEYRNHAVIRKKIPATAENQAEREFVF